MLRVHVAPSATANGTLEVYGAPPLSVVSSEQLRLQPTSFAYDPPEQVIAEEMVGGAGGDGGDGGDDGGKRSSQPTLDRRAVGHDTLRRAATAVPGAVHSQIVIRATWMTLNCKGHDRDWNRNRCAVRAGGLVIVQASRYWSSPYHRTPRAPHASSSRRWVNHTAPAPSITTLLSELILTPYCYHIVTRLL